MFSRLKFGLSLALFVFGSALESNSRAYAQNTWTWDGTTSTDWTQKNWTNSLGFTGTNIVPSNDAKLIFSKNVTNTSTFQGYTSLTVNALSFRSASTMSLITGNEIVFQSNTLGATPTLDNSSAVAVSIRNNLKIDSLLSIQSDQYIELAGPIRGAGGITKSGAGSARIFGVPKYYTGDTTITQGTLFISTDFGSGYFSWSTPTFHINGASLLYFDISQFDVGGADTTQLIQFDNVGGGRVFLTDPGTGVGLGFHLLGNFTIQTQGGAKNFVNGRPINLGSSALTVNVARGSDATTDLYLISQLNNSGSLIKTGNGTLELNSNTYTGVTTVSAGTLLATNTSGSATGTGSLTVASGGTLAGGGSVVGQKGIFASAVTIQSGGRISPGVLDRSTNSFQPGIINLQNGLTLESGASVNIQIQSLPATGTSGFSQISLTGGTLDLGNSTLNVSMSYTPSVTDEFLIIHGDPGLSRFASDSSNFITTDGLYFFQVSYDSSGVKLFNFVPVPEPGMLLVMGVGGLGLLSFSLRGYRKKAHAHQQTAD